jgi:hypothetical protein
LLAEGFGKGGNPLGSVVGIVVGKPEGSWLGMASPEGRAHGSPASVCAVAPASVTPPSTDGVVGFAVLVGIAGLFAVGAIGATVSVVAGAVAVGVPASMVMVAAAVALAAASASASFFFPRRSHANPKNGSTATAARRKMGALINPKR